MRMGFGVAAVLIALGAGASGAPVAEAAPRYDVVGKGVAALLGDLAAGRVNAQLLVQLYEARIATIDASGPTLRAVIALSPDALAEAAASDARRARGEAPRPLEGVPILIKDNIELAGPLPTTAGSLALAANVTNRDAPLVARLRAAGAVILGKTNLSEWANFRSSHSISGWSGVGGLTRNPYATDRSACGSSSGSGAAVAASLAPVAIGTETDGSVTCPASMAGLVGLKPTVGLVPRTHIVPISSSQDTAGPMARSAADAALVLAVIGGSDRDDPATTDADKHRFAAALAPDALRGARIGVARFLAGKHDATDRVFADAIDRLRAAGAVLVELRDGPDLDAIGKAEGTVLNAEFKDDLGRYLAGSPAAIPVRSLADVIRFNEAHAARELALFGQDLAIAADATGGTADPAYGTARDAIRRLAGTDGLEPMFQHERLDAIVAPSTGPAWVIDLVNGDGDIPAASTLPAVLGWPHLTVPMGTVDGLPVGLSFIGLPWSDAHLLALGADFERHSPPVPQPSFRPEPPALDAGSALLAPDRAVTRR